MEVFIVLLVLVSVGLVIVGVLRRSREANAAWARVAERFRLRLTPAGFFARHALRGTVDGLGVNVRSVVRGYGKTARTDTVYRVRYPTLRLGLHLRPEGAFAGLWKAIGGRDHLVGHPVFDERVVVQGRSADALRRFLTPERRVRILRAMAKHSRLTITDSELKTSTRGLETNAHRMEVRIQRLCDLARVLTAAPKEDSALDHGLAARREGRLDEALEQVRVAQKEDDADDDVRVLEAEILLATGRREEAASVLEPLREADPEDAEVVALDEDAHRPVKPPPTTRQEPVGEDPLDAEEVCAALFGAGVGFESSHLFAERFAGRSVRWSGELKRVDSFHRDMVFGEGPGTRAVVKVQDVDDGGYGGREVMAVVRLPEGAQDGLRTRRGENVEFEGRLVRCDAFMRNLFVDDGRLVE